MVIDRNGTVIAANEPNVVGGARIEHPNLVGKSLESGEYQSLVVLAPIGELQQGELSMMRRLYFIRKFHSRIGALLLRIPT
ncbi:hypothetical protein GCM10008014_10460 [Paenibacillus silvae]|uniref:Uncharacterized protein n=1 Tax=Paenibacillus silvae TaxID=1325358 RepID=A0ABQ1Z224_9BACL|nr:hypothetical protein [Paenibacillus silvae]GGH47274.1 hypothetical protein GCM10008014_10460 [Paenibacillus silvae]